MGFYSDPFGRQPLFPFQHLHPCPPFAAEHLLASQLPRRRKQKNWTGWSNSLHAALFITLPACDSALSSHSSRVSRTQSLPR